MRPSRSDMQGGYQLRGSYRLCASTGAVTTIAAGTSTAGHLFAFRWAPASLTSYNCYIRRVAARFILTTAYTTAQETGVEMFAARSYSASHTGGTQLDTGSTVANTGKYVSAAPTSLMGVAGLVSIASSSALTAGTQTLDANPIGVLSDWSGAIGDMVPRSTSGAGSGLGHVFEARDLNTSMNFPLVLASNEGFVLRNKVLMGAVGVGRWDFIVEWDEGLPNGADVGSAPVTV